MRAAEGDNMSISAHRGEPVLADGEPLGSAQAAVIMLHGRGARPESILSLAAELPREGIAYLAPTASGATWYPHSFLQPLERNEPYLSAALQAVDGLVAHVAAQGIAHDRIALLGFSQGACLALEYAARNARRYGAVIGLSGGLIGPDGSLREGAGDFDGTPIFLGCSDVDFHIPKARVEESADVLRRMGAEVRVRLYPGMAHTVNEDELGVVQLLVEALLPA